MNPSLKPKIIMFISMIVVMALYLVVFGSKNMVIGLTIVLAAFMSLGNDLSFKPKTSFIKVLFLLLILGIAAYLNNPLTIWGCILTFIVVFATTFTSYSLFGSRVYLPYLMCYFMMIASPVTIDLLPTRIIALALGAVFIVGLNIAVNRKKDYKLSKQTINSLINELNSAVDLRLDGKEVSPDSFKTANGFYSAIYNKFEYKYFPTKAHQSVINIVKSFQYIGYLISMENLSEKELRYIKEVLSKIRQIPPDDIFEGVAVQTNEMYLVLLNLEIIANEINNDWEDDDYLPYLNTVRELFNPIFKSQFSFKSPKFTFAFKMAFILFIWQVLTLIFNLPFTKWLYFITLPLMMPYVDDVAYVAKARIKGTFVGVLIFSMLMIVIPYIPLSPNAMMIVLMVICLFVMIFKLGDKFITTISSTVMSIMTALMYIGPEQAVHLKLLWVVVGVCVVSLFNFKFMPYSVEMETENNLKACCKLNRQSFDLIREKCEGGQSNRKTALIVLTNIVRDNIEVTEDNRELYDLQVKIADICNFILNYLDANVPSDDLKNNLIGIIDRDSNVDDNLNVKENVIAFTLNYVKGLYDNEKAIMRDFKWQN